MAMRFIMRLLRNDKQMKVNRVGFSLGRELIWLRSEVESSL